MNIKKKIRKAFYHATPRAQINTAKQPEESTSPPPKQDRFHALREALSTAMAAALLVAVFVGGVWFLGSGIAARPGTTQSTTPGDTHPDLLPLANDGVYITCTEYDFTIYANMTRYPFFEFCILSEDPLPSGFEITLPDIESSYEVTITQATDSQLDAADTGISKLLALYIHDAQWRSRVIKRVTMEQELYTAYTTLVGEHGSLQAVLDSFDTQPLEIQQLYMNFKQLQDEYQNLKDSYENDLNQAIMPQVKTVPHLYSVKIEFTNVTDEEQIQHVMLSTADKTWLFPVRNLWITNGEYSAAPGNDNPYVEPLYGGSMSPVSSFFIDGYPIPETIGSDWAQNTPFRAGSMQNHFYFTAKQDLGILGVSVYGNNAEQFKILYAEIFVNKPDGTSEKCKWKPQSSVGPMMIPTGSKVTLVVYTMDQNTQNFDYAMNCQLMIHFATENQGSYEVVYRDLQTVYLYRNPKLYASQLYLWAFENAKVEDYYHNYYNPFRTLQIACTNSGITFDQSIETPEPELKGLGAVVDIDKDRVRLSLLEAEDIKQYGNDIWPICGEGTSFSIHTVLKFTFNPKCVEKPDDTCPLYRIIPNTVSIEEQLVPPVPEQQIKSTPEDAA